MIRVNERYTHRLFQVSVFLKGVHAMIECAGGVALALVSTETIARLVNQLTQEELIEDLWDILTTHLLGWAQTFSLASKHFYAFYLNA